MPTTRHNITAATCAATPLARLDGRCAVAKPPLPTDIDPGAPTGLGLLQVKKLTVPQAATMLGIGETKMREIVQKGVIPVIRIMGKTMVLERDLESYLQGNYGRVTPIKAAVGGIAPLPQHVRESKWLTRAE